jgi:hypothetical protein
MKWFLSVSEINIEKQIKISKLLKDFADNLKSAVNAFKMHLYLKYYSTV